MGSNATAAYQNLQALTGNGSVPPGGGNGGGNGRGQVTTTTTTATTSTIVGGGPGANKALLAGLSQLASSNKLSLVNATTVTSNVWINTGSVSLGTLGVNGALSQVGALAQKYGAGSADGLLYVWTDNTGALNVGLFQVKGGVTDLYYFTIRP